MKFQCTINMDNAAFSENEGELADILHHLSDRVVGMSVGDSGRILDTNGNSVGTWKVTK